jgi:N-acetylglutamate synthase-like GNAT family acetyltransferase
MSSIALKPAVAEDATELAELRVRAMRPSLEAVGRFDPERARTRFLDSFDSSATWHILEDGKPVGVLVLRAKQDHLLLDHLYVEPGSQGQNVGHEVMQYVLSQAKQQGLPVKVGALKGSRSNEFYIRHGFTLVSAAEWDNYYSWEPQQSAA